MCDFVDTMRRGCERHTGVLPDTWDGVTLPYADESFDLVLTFSVLLHVLPQNLDRLFAEEVRVAKKWISITSLREWPRPLSGHCFVHDYLALFKRHNLEVLKEHKFGVRSQWLLQKV